MKKLIFPLLSLLILTSCEKVFKKTIDYEIPREEDKIVISSRLVAGDSARAFLSTSVYSMDTLEPAQDFESTVKLYENGVFVEELQPDGNGVFYEPGNYVGTHPIMAGKTYKVEASRPGFKTAYGENLVPAPVSITRSSISTSQAQQEYRLQVDFKDPAGEGDYYYFFITLENQSFGGRGVLFSTLDPTVEVFDNYNDPFSDEQGTSGYEGYLSDQYFNGGTKRLDLDVQTYFNGPTPDTNITVVFNLYHISMDYYQHEKTKAAQDQSDGGLFSEPVQVYTNIVNGYGVVAGASLTREEIKP